MNKHNPWLVDISEFKDERGLLQVIDRLEEECFLPRRIFVISDVPEGITRGSHGHKSAWQLLLALNGSVEVHVENSNFNKHFILASGAKALCIPPNNWVQFKLETKNTHLVVLASENFDSDDYIVERP